MGIGGTAGRGRRALFPGAKRFPSPAHRKDTLKPRGLTNQSVRGSSLFIPTIAASEPHASLLPKAIIEGDPYKIRGLFVPGRFPHHLLAQFGSLEKGNGSIGIPGHHQSAN